MATSETATMDETNRKAQAVKDASERPDPTWIRGVCPDCGDDLVSNLYYIGGKGYIMVWECWSSLGAKPTCAYRKVL